MNKKPEKTIKPPPTALPLLAAVMASMVCLMGVDALGGQMETPLTVAETNRTDFTIVQPVRDSGVLDLAASELRRYLGVMSGARFDVMAKPTNHFILVCSRATVPAGVVPPADIGRMSSDGYCIAVREGNLLLIGADERGALYAVYDMLQRLGCRWLAPAFSFYEGAHEVVPKCERLALSLSADVIEQPVFKYRKLYVEEGRSHCLENLRQMIAWMPKRRFNTLVVPLNYAGGGRVMWDNWREGLIPELRQRAITIEVGGHGYENYLSAAMEDGQLYERHPEWFAMDDQGRRSRNTHTVFCTSNRDARAYLIGSVIRYLDAHPEIEIFDFWPPDGTQWCQCDNCKALGAPGDRQALLLSEVASAAHKTHPGLKFETIAYAACVRPPAKEALDPEVLLDFCPISQCFEFQINDPESKANAAYVSQLKAWFGTFRGDISIYSYYRKYAWQSLPVLLPHYLQSDLRFYQSLGARGISSYAEPGDWGTYELNHYVLGGLAWNPQADVDAMILDFSGGRFGAQAALGRKAYEVLEATVRHVCNLPGTGRKTGEEYERAAGSLDALERELESARAASADKATVAALNRLRLDTEYGRRSISIQQSLVEHENGRPRTAASEDLKHFLEAHAQDGVFIDGRITAAK